SGLTFGKVGYEALVNGSGLRLGVSYDAGAYRLGDSFAALKTSGAPDRFELNGRYPLVRSGVRSLDVEAQWDRTTLRQSVASISQSERHIGAYGVALSGHGRFASGIIGFTAGVRSGSLRFATEQDRLNDA